MVKVFVGERRTLRFTVENIEGKDFSISNAQYTVKLDDAIESSGMMVINDHEMSFLFAPKSAGVHTIILQYTVGVDVLKGKFIVDVVDE